MLRMHTEILFCRKKRESERKIREGKGTKEGMHTRGNNERGNKGMEKLNISKSKTEIRKEEEREKKKGKE
jgi:hypothetical protein